VACGRSAPVERVQKKKRGVLLRTEALLVQKKRRAPVSQILRLAQQNGVTIFQQVFSVL
jgi:hypothetical protein